MRGHTGPSFLVGEAWLHPLHPLLPMDGDDGIVGFTRELSIGRHCRRTGFGCIAV